MSDKKRFAVDAQVRVKNPGVNGVVTQFDDKPTALGEYWHTIQTEHGDRREPGCNLELLPRPLTNSEAGAPRSNQLGKESLLAQIDEIIKTMPPRATIRHDVQENHNWFGRVSAAIEKWNPSKSVLLREYLNLFFSNGHARERAHGLNKLLVLLNQAHDELKTAQTQELMDHENGSAMQPALEQVRPTPKAFISYGWESDEHRSWVRELASRLRADGVNVSLDQWELQPGDQLPAFMERAVRENDYVLIVCTPQYKRRSDERLGGVGYEGDIMTAEALTSRNQRKFIPLFQSGNDWRNAGPTWVQGKYYIDFRGDPYSEERYQDLITTLHGTRPAAPPIGSTPRPARQPGTVPVQTSEPVPPVFEPIQILGVVVDEITEPRADGAPGSALYTVPFQLSRRPSSEWATVFVEKWNHPRSWTSMHRPGIASVRGEKVYLTGTTVEEVQKYHRDTLKLALEDTNTAIAEYERRKHLEAERERVTREQHAKTVRDAAKDITF